MTGMYWTPDGEAHELVAASTSVAMDRALAAGAVRVIWNGEVLRRIEGALVVMGPATEIEAFAIALRTQLAVADAPFSLTAPVDRGARGRQDSLFT